MLVSLLTHILSVFLDITSRKLLHVRPFRYSVQILFQHT
jgi:hypothetical protein